MNDDDSRQTQNPPASPRPGLVLEVLQARFAVCRLAPDSEVPSWATGGSFSSISRSAGELSIVCEERQVSGDVKAERGWRAVRVLGPAGGQQGPLDFALIGVLASLALPLAKAKVSLFSVSTYDTDYILVRARLLGKALAVLRREGHEVVDEKRAEKPKSTDGDSSESPNPDSREGRSRRPRRRRRPRRTPQTRPETEERAPVSAEAEPSKAPSRAAPKPRPAKPPSAASDIAKEVKTEVAKPAADSDSDHWYRPATKAAEKPADKPVPPAKTKDSRPTKADKPNSEAPVADAAEVADKPRPAAAAPKREASPSPSPKRESAWERDEGAQADGLATGAIPQHPVETTDRAFDELGLSHEIVAAVKAVGFEHPTPIQAGVIPLALEGRDIIGLAETGSGKTAAFVLPIAARLYHGSGTRGVIVCPTREIALQTKAFLDLFGKNHRLKTVCVIGGVKIQPQIDSLRRGVDLIVATPGRLLDHMERGNVHLDGIKILVLDEADHMLDLGFQPQINSILRQLPGGRQTMLFSATMRPAIERMAKQYTDDPHLVDIRPKGRAAQGIDHRLYLVDDRDRNACLVALLKEIPGSTLIFTRRRLHAEWLARLLEKESFEVDRIHSDRSQAQRVRALKDFREGKYRILVATDVAARGLDIPAIRHVINFGLPESAEDYVHRAGRTARGTAIGTVSSIGTWLSKPMVREIESTLDAKLERYEAPGIEPYREIKRRKTIRRRLL